MTARFASRSTSRSRTSSRSSTYPTAFVVDQQQIESNPRGWTRRPIGTGAYRLQEWRIGERIVLRANPRFHFGEPSVRARCSTSSRADRR